ncbi:MAG: hypothetical protein P4N60_05435 [Verrucomicrobiae bacterium]|nr:hypothetical protein [Verrucomicrobiae bacterium]
MWQFRKSKIAYAALVLILVGVLRMVSPVTAAAGQSVTFGWEPSADPSVAGYNIYYGTASQLYTNKVSVGNMTTATIAGLVEGQTYYFAATTYDGLNLESVFSDEIAYTVPLPETNQPPAITQMPGTIIGVIGQGIGCEIMATGDGALTYGLGSGMPTGATIDPNTGWFDWRPQVSQVSSTNIISVTVTDSGNPPLSTSQSFTIVVQDYIHISIGSAVVATNSAGGLALAVYASTPVASLQFMLDYPPGLLTNFSITGANALQTSVTPIAPGQVLVAVSAGTGQPIIGAQTLGTIRFNAIAAANTMSASLATEQPLALKTDGTQASHVAADPGQVTVVGEDSMVEARQVDGVRSLIVYGPTGATYQVESCNALGNLGQWVGTADPFIMTNLSQTILLPADTNSATFYRTRMIQ